MRKSDRVVSRVVLLLAVLSGGSLVSLAWAGVDEGIAAYERGEYATAYRQFLPLAKQGNATAQYKLGVMYDVGLGVPQDYATAVTWYRKAAEQGDGRAQQTLGIMYTLGEGVPQDYNTAVSWYRKAAEQGYAFAQASLGFMYKWGQSVPQDYVQAHLWLNLAAAQLPPGEDRDATVKDRDRVAAKMTRDQLAEAQRRAHEWRPKSP